MDHTHIKWGKYPDQFNFEHQREEQELIVEWREWNSDLLVGQNLVKNSRKDDTIEFGKRIVLKCMLEMSLIVKRLEEIRNG